MVDELKDAITITEILLAISRFSRLSKFFKMGKIVIEQFSVIIQYCASVSQEKRLSQYDNAGEHSPKCSSS
jgi:hypothetical protein